MTRGQLQIAESVDPTAILDTFDVDHGGETVKREIVALGGAADDALVEPTNAAPGSSVYGLPMRIGDGHDANAGATDDAMADAGGEGTASAKLRRLTNDLDALLAGQSARGVTLSTVKHAVISLGASGEIVAAVTSKQIRILSAYLIASGAVTFAFSSHSTGNISGVMQLATAAGLVLGWNEGGWGETVAGEALYGTLGASVQVSGAMSYVEV